MAMVDLFDQNGPGAGRPLRLIEKPGGDLRLKIFRKEPAMIAHQQAQGAEAGVVKLLRVVLAHDTARRSPTMRRTSAAHLCNASLFPLSSVACM